MKEEPQFQLPLEMPAYVRSPALQSRVSLRVRDALRELPEEFRFRELREKLYDLPEAALRRALNDMRDLGQVECMGKGKTARWVRNAAF
jgi:DNA-binding transcriptional ArsR family regulator